MDRKVVILLACILSGCSAPPPSSETRPATADSLVLERSPCFGRCPDYRLRIRSDGNVVYQSRTPADTTRGVAQTQPGTLAKLVARARAIGFYALPEDISSDSALCSARATDHPSATITIFEAGKQSRVVHYHGCRLATDHSVPPQLQALTAFEVAIDSAAGSSRWLSTTGSKTR